MRAPAIFGLLCILVLSLFSWTLMTGPVDLSLYPPDIQDEIFYEVRLPRAVASLLCGISLSVSGLSLQSVFRNPLCGPFVLGISSGASLGAALALLLGVGFGSFSLLGGASCGALAVTLAVLFFARRFKGPSILVVGLLIGYFVDAAVSIVVDRADAESLKVFVSWGMGSFGRMTADGIAPFFLVTLAGLLLLTCSMKYLNACRLGEDFARGLGIRVGLSRTLVLLGCSILAGASTAFCGPVAFVGIAIPHLTYLLFKSSNHRVLLPGSALCGAILCLLAGKVGEGVPLNSILSIVGVPVVLWVLVRSRKRGMYD